VDKTASVLSECFGGATSCKCIGYWTSAAAGLVKENTTQVFAYCNQQDLEKLFDVVYNLCLTLKKEMNQEAIALEINGEMYFI
jgi:hypothetical protein